MNNKKHVYNIRLSDKEYQMLKTLRKKTNPAKLIRNYIEFQYLQMN